MTNEELKSLKERLVAAKGDMQMLNRQYNKYGYHLYKNPCSYSLTLKNETVALFRARSVSAANKRFISLLEEKSKTEIASTDTNPL